jgi:hypothetical protein
MPHFFLFFFDHVGFVTPEFLSERRLVETGNISALAQTRLGIEGANWLKKLPVTEPFQAATGGAPLTLAHALDAELDKFK